jgi:hypothetical protein
MQAGRLIASELNAPNREMHAVADGMEGGDWLRRGVPGTNLPAFDFWHIVRVVDSTVNLGLRGTPEVIASEPWASRAWARPDIGTGYSREKADALAAQVAPDEVLAYADAVRAQVNQWLRALSDEELDAPAPLLECMRSTPAYNVPAILEATAQFEGQPAWLVLTFACFAHGWAHLAEIRLLTNAGHHSD